MLAAFENNPDLQVPSLFFDVTADNRVRVFEIASGNLKATLSEPHHLSAEYTCFTPSPSASSKKRKSEFSGLAAIGSAKGSIVLFNLQKDEVVLRFEGHTARVNDVIFNEQGNLLFSCSEDKQVMIWNTATGELIKSMKVTSTAPNRLSLSADGSKLIVASSVIVLVDLSSFVVSRKFVGHVSKVTKLAVSPDGSFLLSSSENDRYISIWSLSDALTVAAKNKKKKQEEDQPALATFALDSAPTSLVFSNDFTNNDAESKESKYYIAASSESNSISVFSFSSSTHAVKNVSHVGSPSSESLQKTVGNTTGSKSASRVTTSSSEGAVSSLFFISLSKLLVARHTTTKPVFTALSLLDENGSIVDKLSLPAISQKALFQHQNESKKRKATSEVTILDPSVLPSTSLGVLASTSKLSSSLDGLPIKKQKISAELSQTLAERVDELQSQSVSSSSALKSLDSILSGRAPSASSLQTILTQALHTNDDTFLEYCLNYGAKSSTVLIQTVERLPGHYILPFLKKMIQKLQSSPGRAMHLSKWIHQILLKHASYLLALPLDEMNEVLSPLNSLIDSRLAIFKKLVKLQGRLELILAQVGRRTTTMTSESPQQPNVLLEDDDLVPTETAENDEEQDQDEFDENEMDDEDFE